MVVEDRGQQEAGLAAQLGEPVVPRQPVCGRVALERLHRRAFDPAPLVTTRNGPATLFAHRSTRSAIACSIWPGPVSCVEIAFACRGAIHARPASWWSFMSLRMSAGWRALPRGAVGGFLAASGAPLCFFCSLSCSMLTWILLQPS